MDVCYLIVFSDWIIIFMRSKRLGFIYAKPGFLKLNNLCFHYFAKGVTL